MKKGPGLISKLKNERGATAVLVSILMTVFIGITALAVDVGHLYVARNELQNAADAGALAGARFLYTADGSSVNSGANTIADNAAVANMSEGLAVEVNQGDVQRGHWSYTTHTFTPNASLDTVQLFDTYILRIDTDTDFINAVQQVVRRETTPVSSYFAGIFGIQDSSMQAQATAYIGFAGSLDVEEVDLPIAICKESLVDALGKYQCEYGHMINIGESVPNSETGGWTDFNQDGPCGGADASTVENLVGSDGNPEVIMHGENMATSGGGIPSAFDALRERWINETNKNQLWNLTLPVVTCSGNNIGTCEEMVGAVNINIVWITGADDDPLYSDAPWEMGEWSHQDDNGAARWGVFVANFKLEDINGDPAPYKKETIYYFPDCGDHVPIGGTGGENFGILAKVPVLVD